MLLSSAGEHLPPGLKLVLEYIFLLRWPRGRWPSKRDPSPFKYGFGTRKDRVDLDKTDKSILAFRLSTRHFPPHPADTRFVCAVSSTARRPSATCPAHKHGGDAPIPKFSRSIVIIDRHCPTRTRCDCFARGFLVVQRQSRVGGKERGGGKTWVWRYQRFQASPVRGTQGVRQESAILYSNAVSVGEVRGISGRADLRRRGSSP